MKAINQHAFVTGAVLRLGTRGGSDCKRRPEPASPNGQIQYARNRPGWVSAGSYRFVGFVDGWKDAHGVLTVLFVVAVVAGAVASLSACYYLIILGPTEHGMANCGVCLTVPPPELQASRSKGSCRCVCSHEYCTGNGTGAGMRWDSVAGLGSAVWALE